MTEPKPHLSASQINTYLRCPKQWEFRYVKGLIVPPGAALALGKAGHASVEANYRHKIETGSEIPLEAAEDAFSDAFEAALDDGVELEPGENVGDLKDLGLSMSRVHHRSIAPNVDPVEVEKEFRVPITYDYDLVGFMDVVEVDGTIADNKFQKSAPSQEDVQKNLQLKAYAFATQDEKGHLPPRVRLDVVTKGKFPKAVQVSHEVTPNDLAIFQTTAEGVAKSINAGAFPHKTDGWHCSKKWCGFFDRCVGK